MQINEVCAVIERETGQAVTADTLLDAIPMDSLEFVDLILQLGNEAGKDIRFERAAECKTVGDLAKEAA